MCGISWNKYVHMIKKRKDIHKNENVILLGAAAVAAAAAAVAATYSIPTSVNVTGVCARARSFARHRLTACFAYMPAFYPKQQRKQRPSARTLTPHTLNYFIEF